MNLLLFKIAKRHSFIIDPRGKIAKIYRNITPKEHVEEVLKDLQKLQDA
jgi:peroxiredoxin Q/BCP